MKKIKLILLFVILATTSYSQVIIDGKIYSLQANEKDPIFNASVASGITAQDTANWNQGGTGGTTDSIYNEFTGQWMLSGDTLKTSDILSLIPDVVIATLDTATLDTLNVLTINGDSLYIDGQPLQDYLASVGGGTGNYKKLGKTANDTVLLNADRLYFTTPLKLTANTTLYLNMDSIATYDKEVRFSFAVFDSTDTGYQIDSIISLDGSIVTFDSSSYTNGQMVVNYYEGVVWWDGVNYKTEVYKRGYSQRSIVYQLLTLTANSFTAISEDSLIFVYTNPNTDPIADSILIEYDTVNTFNSAALVSKYVAQDITSDTLSGAFDSTIYFARGKVIGDTNTTLTSAYSNILTDTTDAGTTELLNPDYLALTVNTTLGNAGDSIRLAISNTYNTKGTFLWGDGDSTVIDATVDHVTYQYTTGGEYQIIFKPHAVSGQLRSFNFNNAGDKDKILSLDQWGNVNYNFSLGSGHFNGCTNMAAMDTIPDGTTSIAGFFAKNTAVTEIIIPSSVTTLGFQTFDISALTTFKSYATTAPSTSTTFNAAISGATLYRPSGATGYDAGEWANFGTTTDL